MCSVSSLLKGSIVRTLERLLLVLFGCLALSQGAAQSVAISQPLELPIFLNPAQAGNAGAMRFNTFYRNQWLNANSPFNSFGLSFDVPFGVFYNHALGATITNDIQGASVLQHTALNVVYAFMFDLTYEFRIRLGVQAGAIMKSVNYNKLVFPDMLGRENAALGNQLTYANSHRFTYDFAFGAAFEYQIWDFGFAIHNIPEPKFDNRSVATALKIPRKYSLYASMRYNIFEMYRFKTPLYLVPVVHTSFQTRDFDRFTTGTRALNLMAGLRVEFIGIYGALYYHNSILYPKQAISASVGYMGERFGASYAYNMGFMAYGFQALEASVHEVTLALKLPLSKRPRLSARFDKKNRPRMTKYSRKRAGASRSRRRR